uniref:Phospholipase A2 n=1 Tax=Androctonus crassicauda TaxID=122909 RepID=A0AA49XAG2_ANDCR|nr:phospholipase A2-like protein [Androctonus crassicauda]
MISFIYVNGNLLTTFYKEKDANRMVEMIRMANSDGNISDCYMYGNRIIIEKVLDTVPKNLIRIIPKNEMNECINNCTSLLLKKLYKGAYHMLKTRFDYIRKLFKSFLIFPGTKWCGDGNIADGYDDLGPLEETDKCCRSHDHCNFSISGYENNFCLKNTDFFTKSHCDCDDDFQSCLKESNNSVSNLVGNLYFNILQVECFENEYPIIKCIRSSGIRKRCLQYKLDRTKPKKYQFFDAKLFEGKINYRNIIRFF